jgi:hypothetical protein
MLEDSERRLVKLQGSLRRVPQYTVASTK